MRGWMRMALVAAALGAAAGACTRADQIAAPGAAGAARDEAATETGTLDEPGAGTASDSTDGRWGGYMGSGG